MKDRWRLRVSCSCCCFISETIITAAPGSYWEVWFNMLLCFLWIIMLEV